MAGPTGASIDVSVTESGRLGGEKRVEMRVYRRNQISTNCLVICEFWPDWLFTLVPLGWGNIRVFCDVKNVRGLLTIGSRRKEIVCWEPLCGLQVKGAVPSEPGVAWISGSMAFTRQVVKILCGWRVVVAVGGCSRGMAQSPGVHQTRWGCIMHADVGGVTTSRVRFGIPREVRWSGPEGYVRRSVRHVVKYGVPTERGLRRSEVDAMTDSSLRRSFLSPSDLLPRNSVEMQVAVSTHMSASGWGLRKLSREEIMLAWDIPVSVAAGRDGVETFSENELALLLNSCPVKVLHAVADAVTTEGTEAGWLEDASSEMKEKVASVSVDARGIPPAGYDVLIGDRPVRDWANEGMLQKKELAKHDDSDPPIYLWDNRILMFRPTVVITQRMKAAFMALRLHTLRRMRRRTWESLRDYLRSTHGRAWPTQRRGSQGQKRKRDQEDSSGGTSSQSNMELERDLEAGRDAMGRLADGQWWAWNKGSRLLFWMWPEESKREARDGTRLWVMGDLPQNRQPQRPCSDKRMRGFVGKKIATVRERGYVEPGLVRSLTNYFPVIKILEDDEVKDVRMVYDGTRSGLNAVLWAPNFGLPTMRSHMRMVSFETELGDLDMGEMFLNFMLSMSIRPYAGIDLTPLAKLMGVDLRPGECLWERWSRMAMGFRPSPFAAIRMFLLAEEVVRGDRREKSNWLRWDKIRLNLPASKGYDPTLPWVSKVVLFAGFLLLAADFITFVDDIRTGGPGREWAWRAMRQIGSRLNALGIQDAPRKRVPPSAKPGAWAGSIAEVKQREEILNRVTQEKWEKGKRILEAWLEEVRTSQDGCTGYKAFLKDRGFMVHLTGAYDCMIPYMKGIHQTADTWRKNRGADGWKVPDHEWRTQTEWSLNRGDNEYSTLPVEEEAPERVKFAPLFEPHVRAMLELMDGPTPRKQIWRSKRIFYVFYGFGDASGSGFGSTWTTKKSDGIQLRVGVWSCTELSESSNWKEGENVVASLEEAGRRGELDDAEIFFNTDNSTWEAAAYSGTSSSRKLFELVLRVRKLEMIYRCIVRTSHVAGTRMIAQATDGVSRGNIEGGVLEGIPMTEFIPFNETALERTPALEDWIRSWAPSDAVVLEPEDWFELGHDIRSWKPGPGGLKHPVVKPGTWIWAPPPAAADAALEEMRKARHKRQNSLHIFICPRLLTPMWRKLLHKASDVVMELPVGPESWPASMHEPLLMGVCLPFIRHRPWQLRNTPKLCGMGRQVLRLWKNHEGEPAPVLRKLCALPGRLDSLPRNVVWRMLQGGRGSEIPGPSSGGR